MNKKCVFFICAVFVLEVKSDCDGYFECFNSFFTNFFGHSEDNIQYLNTTTKELPENFVQVQDIQISELEKALVEISSFVQQGITDQLKTQSDSAVFTNVNPHTKIYVKTFNYNNPGISLPDFENIYSINNEPNVDEVKDENHDIKEVSPTPQTTTKSVKTKIVKDIRDNEIPNSDDVVSYYDSVEDNSTDYPIMDYVELYKDTTNEENVYNPTEVPINGDIRDEIQETMVEYVDEMERFFWDINNGTDSAGNTDVSAILPWISTIFLKNDTKSNQFEYFCDGALLNDKLLITAARCVTLGNTTVDPDSLLVILGKRSLLSMADKEQAVKIKQIITHENFTNENGTIENDLALLIFENPVKFNELIQPATIGNGSEVVEKSFTTAWSLQGDIVPVSLEDTGYQACSKTAGENMLCAVYGLDVALCPSYGGLVAGRQAVGWRLYGVRSGDTADRGLCFDKHVWYTDLRVYDHWIMEWLQ